MTMETPRPNGEPWIPEVPDQPLPLASNPETQTEEDIQDVLERGGPFFTLTFESVDKMFSQTRVLGFAEAEELYANLGEQIAQAKTKYNMEAS